MIRVHLFLSKVTSTAAPQTEKCETLKAVVNCCLSCHQHQSEDDVMELHTQDMKHLKPSLVEENRMLLRNIRDAEAALRTLARYF